MKKNETNWQLFKPARIAIKEKEAKGDMKENEIKIGNNHSELEKECT